MVKVLSALGVNKRSKNGMEPSGPASSMVNLMDVSYGCNVGRILLYVPYGPVLLTHLNAVLGFDDLKADTELNIGHVT